MVHHYQTGVCRIIAILIIGCCFMLSLAGCLADGSETTQTQTDQTTIDATVDESDDLAGGERTQAPIRIWWPERTSLNPLLDRSLSGQAVYRLIYRSLFTIQSDDQLTGDLAESLTLMDDGLTAVVVLKEQQMFHDGTVVTAADAAAVIQWLRTPDNESSWSSGLSRVSDVQAVGERVVRITLTEKNPWIGYALTFPIIPQSETATEPLERFTGSGRYEIDQFDPEAGLVLKPADSSSEAPTLLVKSYINQSAAMRAFEKDELDLVLLDTRQMNGYTVRSSLRVDRFSGPEVIMIAFENQQNEILSDSGRLCFLKSVIQQFKAEPDVLDTWGEASFTGLSSQSIFNEGIGDSAASLFERCKTVMWREEDIITMIAPDSDERRVALIRQIAAFLEDEGIPGQVQILTDDAFSQAVKDKQYDLALLSVMLPSEPEPGFLVRDPMPLWCDSILSLDLNRQALENAQFWQNQLNQLEPFDETGSSPHNAVNRNWRMTMAQALARTPFEIVCVPYMGIAYGDRVRGHLNPSRYHPYEQIEELWKWSGSSLLY